MRVLIDTNVLISAALSANGVPYQAYVKAVTYPNHGLIEAGLEKPVIMTPAEFIVY